MDNTLSFFPFYLKKWYCVKKQGCALAEPGGPWRLTLALRQLGNLSRFFRSNDMLGTLDFTRSRALGSLQFSLEQSPGVEVRHHKTCL